MGYFSTMDVTRYISAAEAVKKVASGNRVFMQGGAATPVHLVKALQQRHAELEKVELISITTLGDLNFDDPAFINSFYINSLFVSANTRSAVNSENGDYVPVFLSQIPQLFRKNILPVDVALIHVSMPDQHGFCTLGTSVDVALSAVQNARYVIAQVNPKMPRTHGDGFIHINKMDALVNHECDLPEVDYSKKVNNCIARKGKNVASLVEDGAT